MGSCRYGCVFTFVVYILVDIICISHAKSTNARDSPHFGVLFSYDFSVSCFLFWGVWLLGVWIFLLNLYGVELYLSNRQNNSSIQNHRNHKRNTNTIHTTENNLVLEIVCLVYHTHTVHIPKLLLFVFHFRKFGCLYFWC